MIEARIERQDKTNETLYKHLDRMFAKQTAQLSYMQGRIAQEPIQPESCMTFDWDGKQHRTTPEEMTDKMLDEFDRNMDGYANMRRNG